VTRRGLRGGVLRELFRKKNLGGVGGKCVAKKTRRSRGGVVGKSSWFLVLCSWFLGCSVGTGKTQGAELDDVNGGGQRSESQKPKVAEVGWCI